MSRSHPAHSRRAAFSLMLSLLVAGTSHAADPPQDPAEDGVWDEGLVTMELKRQE